MTKRQRKDIAPQARGRSSDIRSGGQALVPSGLPRFSFKYYDPGHATCHCRDQGDAYFHKLPSRIKDLGGRSVDESISAPAGKALRFHRVDLDDGRVS